MWAVPHGKSRGIFDPDRTDKIPEGRQQMSDIVNASRLGALRTNSCFVTPSVAEPRRSSHTMWRTSATRRPLPFHPTAQAGGFPAAFR